jgi:hypothetical protein
MALKNTVIKEQRQRKYLARDFDSFRAQLVTYARRYYPNTLQDFTENGLGGLLVDLAANVGDNLAFYLDHVNQELDPATAVEDRNIERHLRNSGVTITGASPANVVVQFYIQVPSEQVNFTMQPQTSALPIIKAGSKFSADNGTIFMLVEDVDFRKLKSDGTLIATQKIGKSTSTGDIQTFILVASGTCVSGQETTDTFTINNTFIPFRKLTLTNPDVTQIISVNDSYGNEYYEVSALTDDVVYKNMPNVRDDVDDVPEAIQIIPAPYRFTVDVTLNNRKSTLTFGGGNVNTVEDDIIPDPSEFAINFKYRRTFSRQAINPAKMLQTKTLGTATTNTELTVLYRYGGGLDHCVGANEIRSIETLIMEFPNNPSSVVASQIRQSVEISNSLKAVDGEDAPSVDELKFLIPSANASQERSVSRPDLLARVFTMPSNFGRVYRAAIRKNPNNVLSTQLFVVSRDSDGMLTLSSDSLKLNLVKYLTPYRMINDAVDILDAQIINLQTTFEVVIDPNLNKSLVLQQVMLQLKEFFRVQHFYIDQPLILSEVRNNITSIRGIISLNSLTVSNVTNVFNGRTYNSSVYDIQSNTIKDIIFPPEGGIFEMKYPDVDIVGYAI